MRAYLHSPETIGAAPAETRPYSVVLAWDINDMEQGTYGWAGQATDFGQAEAMACTDMLACHHGNYCAPEARDDPADCPDCQDREDRFAVLETYVGANIWAAPQMLAALQAINAIACDTPASFRAVIPEVIRDQVRAAIVAGEGRS